MDDSKTHRLEVWSQLLLCEEDTDRVRDFLISDIGVRQRFVVRKLHLTVYHARRPMNVACTSEDACVIVPAAETRFMVMAPSELATSSLT